MSICILADAADIDRAKLIELEYMSVDDLKKLNKNKKLVKKVNYSKLSTFISFDELIPPFRICCSSPRSTTLSSLPKFSSSKSLVSSVPVSQRLESSLLPSLTLRTSETRLPMYDP